MSGVGAQNPYSNEDGWPQEDMGQQQTSPSNNDTEDYGDDYKYWHNTDNGEESRDTIGGAQTSPSNEDTEDYGDDYKYWYNTDNGEESGDTTGGVQTLTSNNKNGDYGETKDDGKGVQTSPLNTTQYKANGKLKKLKPSKQAKRIAKLNRKPYYKARNKAQLKALGRGALAVGRGLVRGAGTAMGVAAGATVAIGATIASGDVDKLGTNLATGVLAGAKGGRTASDFAIGATGAISSGIINGVSSDLQFRRESKQAYEEALMKEDKDYKKNKELREQHKASKSLETQAAIRAHYGYKRIGNSEDIKQKEQKIEKFMNYGVNNVENAMRAMDLMDSQGLTEKQAMMAALQSERFEKDDDAKRSAIREQMTNAFLKGYVNKGYKSEDALERAMADSHAVLANADRIHGVKEAEVGRQEKEYMKMKEYEKAKRRRESKEAAQMNADAAAAAQKKASGKGKKNR